MKGLKLLAKVLLRMELLSSLKLLKVKFLKTLFRKLGSPEQLIIMGNL